MITTAISENKELYIKLHDRFDFNCLKNFRSAYEKVNHPVSKYIIDFEHSDYIDSSGLGMLLALKDYAGGEVAEILLINCNHQIRKIFCVTKLDDLFKFDKLKA